MKEIFSRTAMLLGDEAMERLAAARVAVFGVGGVGGVGGVTLPASDTAKVPSSSLIV